MFEKKFWAPVAIGYFSEYYDSSREILGGTLVPFPTSLLFTPKFL